MQLKLKRTGPVDVTAVKDAGKFSIGAANSFGLEGAGTFSVGAAGVSGVNGESGVSPEIGSAGTGA
jgi:hypothetical protein